jgi:mannose-1-phosphate guanylyltransferase
MKAVILVGGEGTRLRPLTVNVPKPMLPVVNRPFLEHVLEYLKSHGIHDVILSMGYRSEVIERHFGDGKDFGINLRYVVESSPLGTAGGVKNVERYIDGTFLVFNGDILTDLDLRAMIDFHRRRGAKATISLTPVDDPTSYGLVETDTDGHVQRFIEKPRLEDVTTNLINAGTYILEPDVLDLIPADTYHMFERGVFPDLLSRHDPIYGYRSDAYWIDIGTPAKYMSVQRDILNGRIQRLGTTLVPSSGIRIGTGTVIDPSAKMTGPAVLGDGVRVAAGARISGPVVVGDDCSIGPDAIVEEAILWPRVRITARAKLSGAILGADVVVEDDSAVVGGAVVADGCTIGPENRLDRGIRIWPGHAIPRKTISF